MGRLICLAATRAVLDDPEHYARLVSEFERISGQTDEMIASMFHLHAMHLLAKKWETRAFLPLMGIAELPQSLLDEVLRSFDRIVQVLCCSRLR